MSQTAEGFTPEELAGMVARLRYDGMAEFLGHLADRLNDGADLVEGFSVRKDLETEAAWLKSVANKITMAKIDVRTLWTIFRPHTKEV